MSQKQLVLRSELDDCDAVIAAVTRQWSMEGMTVMPTKLMELRHTLIVELQQMQLREFNNRD